MRKYSWVAIFFSIAFSSVAQNETGWIKINQLGYGLNSTKVSVLGSKEMLKPGDFEIIDVVTGKKMFTGDAGRSFGAYGPFKDSYRLDFSSFKKNGKYFIRAGLVKSPAFIISNDVYKGKADFCLRYMRQQRNGFNPFLKDSCHTHDGYTLYAPVADSTHIDVVGGWHDASDYLQYSTTTANAAYHLLAAYRDFGNIFEDEKNARGLDGKNGIADVLDEAKWGLDWLLKMHPKDDWLFNQLGDDRDHSGMRLPKEDSAYGKGYERPVYFCNGMPQVRGKFMNNSTGVASTAGKFAAAFALGTELFQPINKMYADVLSAKSKTALQLGWDKPGVSQTASVLSPYIYAEDNWKDDMELGAVAVYKNEKGNPEYQKNIDRAYQLAKEEPLTPWLGADTAKHYQWYPFINVGHYELAKSITGKRRDTIIAYYKEGIEKVWSKARNNAFYRGIPFIWCSNNLTVSFAIQCYWYRQLTNDNTYIELEQACFDWIFGVNPWGTSMVCGLPADGDTPVDPHSSFTHLKNYPIDGGLVDGPVYTNIYKNLIGIRLADEDEYAPFQSDLAVYHDDVGDYSTNEPTMDGTASLIYLLAAKEGEEGRKGKAEGRRTSPATLSGAASAKQESQRRSDKTKKVIFVIVDGIPADVIEKLSTPFIDEISKKGGYRRAFVGGEKNGYSQTPTISAVGYNTVLTGTWVNKHNVWDNDIADPNYHYKSIFRHLKDHDSTKKIAIFSTWLDNRTKLAGENLKETNYLQFDHHFDGLEYDTIKYPHDERSKYIHAIDEVVVDSAAAYISTYPPDLTWVYLQYTDDMGHIYGDGNQFYHAVDIADKQIGRLWKAIKTRRHFNEDWLIVITTDHGRDAATGKHHGGQSDRERLGWIATNAHGLNAHFRKNEPSIADIMPTIARFLEITIPKDDAMEIDGVPLTGKIGATNPQASLENGKLIVQWKKGNINGNAKIWLASANNYKTGGDDEYDLVATVPIRQEKAIIETGIPISGFYKIVIETPVNYLNRWIIAGQAGK